MTNELQEQQEEMTQEDREWSKKRLESFIRIAELSYDAVSSYNQSNIGELPYKLFVELSDEEKLDVVKAVQGICQQTISSVAWLHESWMETKKENGWKYGAVWSERDKTHPNLVQASWLHPEHITKYFIFFHMTKTLYRHLLNDELKEEMKEMYHQELPDDES